MGRGPFYGGARKMRGFPLNMSPGSLDDQQPGFPYFAGSAEVKFEFGYGPGSFHPDFFGHHGGPHPGAGPGGPFGHPGKHLYMRIIIIFCTSKSVGFLLYVRRIYI